MTDDDRDDILLALDTLCPMHCLVDADGRILHCGPTLTKLRPVAGWIGVGFLDRFDLMQPSGVRDMKGLRMACTRRPRLRLRLRDHPRTDLQGLLVPFGQGGAIIDLAFGISTVEAVRDYALTNTDFAATDPTVEMLFLIEAKSAAMDASRTLARQLQDAKAAAEEQALTDALTGLRNRRALDGVLSRMIGSGQEFALMHVDLDFFKQVNDTLGHAAGDHVLSQVARFMVEETREDDVVARVGGDEFVVVFHGQCDRRRIADIARRLIARLERPIDWQGNFCRISASLGTVLSTDYARPDAVIMLADADQAQYDAKRAGRAQHRFHEPAE